MKISPFKDQVVSTARNLAPIDAQGLNLIQRLTPTVLGMKVGWQMVIVVHIDCNAKELADTRHTQNLTTQKLHRFFT
jgi:hypothetical protein